MNPENQDFDDLRRLLKLKRYEQPPPRYFNDFSAHVMGRVRARLPEDRETLFESITWEVPLLQRLLTVFDQKPALAGIFGAAICALLVGGAVYSERMVTPGSGSELAGELSPTTLPTAAAPVALVGSAFAAPVASSTNPVTLFDMLRSPSTEPVNFQPFGR